MRRFFPFIIIIAVALLTLGGATLLYRAKHRAPLSIPADRERTVAQDKVHVLGDPKALITLEEFGDYQCPPCGSLSEPLRQLSHDFPQVRIVFKNFPLAMHQHAHQAALAAEAAGLQGQFWKMHDLLYREQVAWSKAADARELFNAYAAMIKCNLDRFKKDMASPEVNARVAADQQEGKNLGVTNTPTIFVNNREVPPGSLNPASLRAVVEEAIKESNSKGKK